MIMPYPTTPLSDQTVQPNPASQSGQTFGLAANVNQTGEMVPVEVGSQSNQLSNGEIDQKLALA